MQKIKYSIGLVVFTFLLSVSGCKSDDSDSLSEEQIRLSELAGRWGPADDRFVTLDNEDVSSFYQNFSLVLDNKKNFSSSNGNSPVWPASGTFEFEMANGSPDLNRVIRNDGVAINIIELSGDVLRIEFFFDTSSAGGRKMGVSGLYSFELSLQ